MSSNNITVNNSNYQLLLLLFHYCLIFISTMCCIHLHLLVPNVFWHKRKCLFLSGWSRSKGSTKVLLQNILPNLDVSMQLKLNALANAIKLNICLAQVCTWKTFLLFLMCLLHLSRHLCANCVTANKGNQGVNQNRAVRFTAIKASVHPRSDAQGMCASESQMNFVHIPLMRHYRTSLSSNLSTSRRSPTLSRSLNMTGEVLFCFLTQRAWRDRYTTFCTVG